MVKNSRGAILLLPLTAWLGAQQFVEVAREAMPPLPAGSAALVDIDADGTPDLLTELTVYLHNDGHGRFQPRTLGGVAPARMTGFVGGDFDGDGDEDAYCEGFVLVNRGAQGPVWLQAMAAGLPLSGSAIGAADLNLDGKTDLIMGSAIAIANSAITFTLQNAAIPPAFAVADMDNDGDLDIFCATDPIRWPATPWTPPVTLPGMRWLLRNDGSSWSQALTFPTTTLANVGMVVAFDADADGDVDCCFVTQPMECWQNQGGGVFTPWSTNWGAVGQACDVDSDGDTDFVSTVAWSENLGLGSFEFHSIDESWTRPRAHLEGVGDVDGDGDLDLVVADDLNYSADYTYTYRRHILLNEGSKFTTNANALPQYWSQPAAIGDFDGDGFPDVIDGSERVLGDSGGLLWHNSGDGWFTPVHGPQYVAFTLDGDSDGDIDLMGPLNGLNLQVGVNNGRGNFAIGRVTVVPPATHHDLRLAFDADGDGDVDMIGVGDTAITPIPTMIRYDNLGAWTFASSLIALFPSSHFIELVDADFDGDGDRDILAAMTQGNPLVLLRNNGHGFFVRDLAGVTGVSTLLTQTADCNMSVADVDGDGDQDVVVTLVAYSPAVGPGTVLLRNTGGVLSLDPTAMPPLTSARRSMLGDVDGDGHADAVLEGFWGTNTLRVMLNDGLGHFTIHQDQALSLYPRATLVDVDLDGDADLIRADHLFVNRQWHLEAPFVPQIGTPFVYRCGGRAMPNALALPWIGSRLRHPLSTPGLGTLCVDPQNAFPLPWMPLSGEMAEGSILVPVDPELIGIPFTIQALLVNATTVHLTPAKHEIVRG